MKKQIQHLKIFFYPLMILFALNSNAQVKTIQRPAPREITTITPVAVTAPESTLKGNAVGDMQYWDGSRWAIIPVGYEGQVLKLSAGGIPAWFTTVGSKGPAGGIIIYDKGIYSDGWRYIEAAPKDQSTGVVMWGCYGSAVPGATGTAVGTGRANTAAIISACSEPGIAAKLCDDLVLNGFSDWYLPSSDELILMFKQRFVMDIDLSKYFWSSTTCPPNTVVMYSQDCNKENAWAVPFNGTVNMNYFERSVGSSVRAVRVF